MNLKNIALASILFGGTLADAVAAAAAAPEGWSHASPREEIAPRFSFDPAGGPSRKGSFVIQSDEREGLIGRWTRTYDINGGHHYRFSAQRRAEGTDGRRAAVVRILWQDEHGKRVLQDEPGPGPYHLAGSNPPAEPELPLDGKSDAAGWAEVGGIYRAPSKASRAVVELEFRWAPRAKVEWAAVTLTETEKPAPRPARLATIHAIQRNMKTPAERREAFQPAIEEAARQKADLVVMPEMLTFVKESETYIDVAEPMPGPSTEFFGALARKHNLYLVPGLVERDGQLVYNVAVLIGPDGRIAGEYRKICLTPGEIEVGIAPGDEYVVFETRFGKVGLMVCYDGFFPEVTRELVARGAEVIAWPVWGCHPVAAAARAFDNQVFVVSSTDTPIERNWMVSAVFDQTGVVIAQARERGAVAVAEVDLAKPIHWSYIGNYKAAIPRHWP